MKSLLKTELIWLMRRPVSKIDWQAEQALRYLQIIPRRLRTASIASNVGISRIDI